MPPTWFDIDTAEQDFGKLCNDIILSGVRSPQLNIPASNIAAIFVVPLETDLANQGVVISQGPVGKQ